MRISKLVSASVMAFALAATMTSVAASGQSATPAGAAQPEVATATLSPSGGSPSLQFATLKDVKAVPMASGELDAVKGLHVHFRDAGGGAIHLAGDIKTHNNWQNLGGSDGLPVAPSYHGLCVAAGISSTGGISIPGAAVQC